jgi:hypothetical protein
MSNRPDPMIPPTVADAEQAISRLENKRNALLARGTELATNRASVAYKALNDDDAVAKQKLDQIGRESSQHSHDLASVDAALKTAQQRLEAAKRHQAKQADREQAKALRDALQQFVQHAAGVDSALEVLVASCNGLAETLVAMHRSGSQFPTDAQLMSFGGRVLLGALAKTPFRRNFETLPPDQRSRTMSMVVQQWSDTVERSIAQRLGDQTTNTPEAA